jgi:hypothetical protein
MARIRSIKPEFWVSEQIAECSTNARLTFIGLWNFSDDRGVHPAKPRTLKAEVFPMDDFSADQVAGWMQELVDAGLVAVFTADDGQDYWSVTGWAQHQKIDRPSFKHPEPPCFSGPVRRELAEASLKPRDRTSSATPRIGVEGSGKEGSGDTSPSSNAGKPASPPFPAEAIRQLYGEILPELPGIKRWDRQRQAPCRSRWDEMVKERGWTTQAEGLAWFRRFFEVVARSDFLMRRTPPSPGHESWRCDIDHLMSRKGFTGVIEGKYGGALQAQQRDQHREAA